MRRTFSSCIVGKQGRETDRQPNGGAGCVAASSIRSARNGLRDDGYLGGLIVRLGPVRDLLPGDPGRSSSMPARLSRHTRTVL